MTPSLAHRLRVRLLWRLWSVRSPTWDRGDQPLFAKRWTYGR